MSNRQFLVICRVGDNSLHKEWIADSARNFDLFLSYFGNTADKYKLDADYYEEVKGPKWPELHRIIMENKDLVSRYDAVWLPDDDLSISTKGINRMFNLFSALELKLGQPALTMDSHVVYKELIAVPDILARHVNFIEVMAPIFSRECLSELQDTFCQSTSGWGLDRLWPVLLNYKEMAVLDATPVIHTRPVGGELYKNNAMNPENDIAKLASLYPNLNISTDYSPNKFRIFSVVQIAYRTSGIARLAARLLRKKNKIKYKKTQRFGAKQKT